MMKVIKGDIIQLAKRWEFDAIIHGCNCFNTFGAGLALQIKNNFRQAFIADQLTVRGDKNKLGTIDAVQISYKPKEFFVINAYTQYKHWGPQPRVSYEAIESCFQQLENDFSGKKIGIPMIGAGLAGGNWEKIKQIIESFPSVKENGVIVEYEKPLINSSGLEINSGKTYYTPSVLLLALKVEVFELDYRNKKANIGNMWISIDRLYATEEDCPER